MNADGAGQTRLTNNRGEDSKPSWSPNGAKDILFNSDRDGDREVFVMNDNRSPRPRREQHHQARHPDEQPLDSGGGDTDARVLNTPSTVSANATSTAGAAVTYSVTATEDSNHSPTRSPAHPRRARRSRSGQRPCTAPRPTAQATAVPVPSR